MNSDMQKTISQKIRTLNEIPLFAAIIVTLEFLFLVLPNISLTPLIFAVYFANRSYKHSVMLITVYMGVEVLQWGISLWVAPMFLGWLLLAVLIKQFKAVPAYIKSFFFAYLYGAMFMPLTVIVYKVDWWGYLVADFPFATTMAITNILTFVLLFDRLSKFFATYNINQY